MSSKFQSIFRIGQHIIDVKRSTITKEGETYTVEQKVIQVLVYLASKQGEVVSYDELLEQVWPNVQVEINTLHRCIAQCRKALNDCSREQAIIKTHAKIGYSLIASVIDEQKNRRPKFDLKVSIYSLAGLLTLLASYLIVVNSNQSTSFAISTMRALSTNYSHEYNATFSPNEKYIVFNRQVAPCKSDIWLKELDTNKATRLTRHAGVYSHIGWSPDSQRLAFVSSSHCDHEGQIDYCQDVRELTIALRKNKLGTEENLLTCHNGYINGLSWSEENEILLIDSVTKENRLLLLKTPSTRGETGVLDILYSAGQELFFDISFSNKLSQLAIASDSAPDKTTLLFFDSNWQLQSKKTLNLHSKNKLDEYLSFDWHPVRNTLFTAYNDLFTELYLDGAIENYRIPAIGEFSEIDISASGESILVNNHSMNRDLFWLDIPQNQLSGESQKSLAIKPLTELNTRFIEEEVQTHPVGNGFAYLTSQYGEKQLWYMDNNSNRKLITNLAQSQAYTWLNDKSLIVIAHGGGLSIVDLEGNLSPISLPVYVSRVFQAINENQLLVEIDKENKKQLVVININKESINLLYEGKFRWAQQIDGGVTYLTNSNLDLVKIEEGVSEVIVKGQHFQSRRQFFILENYIYWQDQLYDIWRLNLTSGAKNMLVSLESNPYILESVSNDGRHLLFHKNDKSFKSILLVKPL